MINMNKFFIFINFIKLIKKYEFFLDRVIIFALW